VSRSTVREIVEAPATVTAKASATVTASADGRVGELRVREGQVVRGGAVLLRIESPDARRQLREARSADARAAAAGAVPVPATGLSQQQREADRTARDQFREARRVAREVPDPQVRAQTLAAVAAAEAQYTAAAAAAQDAVQRFNAGLGSLASAVSSLANAQRVQTRAAVDIAERTVAGLTVRAPISGTVSLNPAAATGGAGDAGGLLSQLPPAVQGQAGQLLGGAASGGDAVVGPLAVGQPVRSGQSLLTVTDASALSLTAQVDETDVLLVKRGVAASAELDAVPDAVYPATVDSIDPVPVTSTRGGVTYVVRLGLGLGRQADGSPAPEPRPGMSAVVGLQVRTAKSVVAVAPAAIFRDGKRDAVWVVTSGVARRRVVRLGAQGETAVEVVQGLRPGERIVRRGADRVQSGQRLP
jgi:multidrug efflux pump subunit AcrA (membrane-fusion protein)